MKTRGMTVVRFALMATLVLTLSACAGPIGTSAPTAWDRQSCAAQEGWWDPGPQECMLMK